MDIVSGIKSEIFRPMAILIIPGIVGAAPFVILTFLFFPTLSQFLVSNSTLATFLGFVVAVGFGLLSSEFGSNFEKFHVDRCLKSADPEYMEDWYRYLRCTFSDQPVGQKYIHNLLLLLHFELNLASALIVCWIGCLVLMVVSAPYSWMVFSLASLLFAIFVLYLLWEGLSTGSVLARVRKELLKGVGSPPIQ